MPAVTQKQIASAVGLSQSAVKAVFSPDPRIRLRPETRSRILSVAQRMGYVPHHAARRLAQSRPGSRAMPFDQVGLIYLVHEIDGVCLEMTQGADHELGKLDASLTFVRLSESRHWERIERLARSGVIDGWLLYGSVNDAVIDRLSATQRPYVILGDHHSSRPVHCVNVDNATAGRMAAEYFASLGHRRIAFLGGGKRHAYEAQTLAAFREAVRRLGLADDEQLIGSDVLWDRWDHAAPFWDAHNAALLLDWLRDIRPTAVFTAELDWADGLWRTLRESGIEVPGEISILGYETASQAARIRGFTRIQLPIDEIGRRAVVRLHQLAAHPDAAFEEIKIIPALVEGWSTSAPGTRSPVSGQNRH